jgi:hypothetical protein
MAEAVDTYGSAFDGGTITCMARVTGADAANIQQADISSGVYSIYLLDNQDPDSRTAVTGHAAVALDVADPGSVIFDTLQTDARWTVDSTGFNFAHTIDISENAAFALAGREYLVEYTLTPVSGQVIIIRFHINVI